FFALPNYGLTLSPLVAGVTALGLYASSYVSEIYRAGLEAVPRGQWEACLTLGLPLRRVWGGVILPQTFRTVLPMMANIMIGMFKDSAILSTITLMELLGRALYIGAVHFRYTEPMTIAGGLFLIISYAAARLTRTLEIRYATKEA
ncbi:MAG: amino acid ABC transporter permease, partial [Pseudorhodoplanes sp.]